MKKSYFLVALLLAVACGTKNSNSASVEATTSTDATVEQPATIVDSASEEKVYHGSLTMLSDLIHTKLEVKPDWQKAYLNGVATITAKPHFYPSDSLILDAKSMAINSVKLNGQTLPFTYTNDKLKIKLDKTYTRKDKYTVVIDYVAKPNERTTGGSAAITSDKGLYFINNDGQDKNKMPQIWTQGETEASSVWFPTIDATNQKTSQEIYITVDNKYATLSNGKLLNSKMNADGTRTDYWKQDLPHAPYLFMMGIGEFKVVKDYYTRKDGSKMDVFYYVEPQWEKYARNIFGKTPEMISYFSKLLNYEYPWDKYNQIVVRDYVSGAMENTGAVVFGDYAYKTDRELLDGTDESTIAHELFHHWFGDLVTCESWANLPLNESFANYSQYLWDEYKYGMEEADLNAESEMQGYMQSAEAQGYHDLIWFDYDENEQMFDGHSYNKGGRILHMLRNYVGDDAFFTALNKYLTDNQYKSAEFHQLRIAFEQVTGEDLNWFFNQWFLASGHPTLEYTQRSEGNEVVLTVKQKQDINKFPVFKLPMQVAVVDNQGTHTHNITVTKVEEEFRFPVAGNLVTLIPDYQEMLLAEVKESKPSEQFVQQFYHSTKWRTKNRALTLGVKKIDSLSSKLVLDALKDSFWAIKTTAIDKASRLKDNDKVMAIQLIKNLAQNDASSAVRAQAVKFLSDEGVADMLAIYEKALTDSSFTVNSAALNGMSESYPEQAMKKAEQLEKDESVSSSMLVAIATMYAKAGNPDKYEFFKTNLMNGKLNGFDALGFLSTFTGYLSGQSVEMADKALEIYTYLEANGGMYTKMFLPQNLNYMSNILQARISSETTKLEEYQKAKDTANAEKSLAAINQLKAVQAKYAKMIGQ
jgi:aminopeptidase N